MYLYNIALKLSEQSLHKKHKMAAVVAKGGSILSKAYNLAKPAHKTFLQKQGHCEQRSLRPHNDYEGATIYIARFGNKMSRPCETCLDLIRKAGIKRMVFCSWDGTLVVEKV